MVNETTTVTGDFECVQCHKRFDKAAALAMHRVRMHTRAGKQGWKRAISRSHRARSRELAQRREHQRQVRADWYAQGLNSHGQPYKSDQPKFPGRRGERLSLEERRAQARERSRLQRERYIAQGLTSKGSPRERGYHPKERFPSRARLKMRAYQQQHYWRKRAEQGYPVPPDKQRLLMAYDAPQPQAKARPGRKHLIPHQVGSQGRAPEKPAAAARHVIFCPVCGTNIQNVQTAVNFGGE